MLVRWESLCNKCDVCMANLALVARFVNHARIEVLCRCNFVQLRHTDLSGADLLGVSSVAEIVRNKQMTVCPKNSVHSEGMFPTKVAFNRR